MSSLICAATVQIGDIDAAMGTARRLHTIDPENVDANRVMALQPGPPPELLQLVTSLLDSGAAAPPGANLAWPSAAELQRGMHQRTIEAALPLVLHQEAHPSAAARAEDEQRMEVDEGGEGGDASIVAMVESTCGHERLKVELASLDWTCLAQQVRRRHALAQC